MKNRNEQQQKGANRDRSMDDRTVGQTDTSESSTDKTRADTSADMMDEDMPV